MPEVTADPKADAAKGASKVSTEPATAPTHQILISSLPETPSLRTPINRWQAGKSKVLSLLGSPTCLIAGVTYLLYMLNVVHIIPRTLWSTHKGLVRGSDASVAYPSSSDSRTRSLSCFRMPWV